MNYSRRLTCINANVGALLDEGHLHSPLPILRLKFIPKEVTMRATSLSTFILAYFAASASGTPATTIIRDSRDPSLNTTRGGSTFTGNAWIDTGLRNNETSIVHVVFEPGARTFWHRHEGGQLLQITAGTGWICDEGGDPQRLNVGDIAWCPPGITHWHGADEGSLFSHFAASFGHTTWLDEVSD